MLHQNRMDELSGRSKNVLATLIREFVRVGKPVGSRRLSRIYSENLSPATLRNVMADLEEAGYLMQPHPSAGRIPTRRGYRFYVRSLLRNRSLTSQETGAIREALEEEGTDPEELMNKTSRLLSSYSNSIGIVLSPPMSMAVLRHIEFVKLASERILVILVDSAGLVRHRLIKVDVILSQAELDQASHYLVENFSGRTLLQIRNELAKLMSQERALYSRLLKNVVLLGSAGLISSGDQDDDIAQVYLGGASRIVQRLDTAEIDRLIALLETFEEKDRLIRIITKCIDDSSRSPSVTIGLEDHIPGMRNWALITSPYQYSGYQAGGSLGILGPSRMEYERAISLVDFVAKLFGKITATN